MRHTFFFLRVFSVTIRARLCVARYFCLAGSSKFLKVVIIFTWNMACTLSRKGHVVMFSAKEFELAVGKRAKNLEQWGCQGLKFTMPMTKQRRNQPETRHAKAAKWTPLLCQMIKYKVQELLQSRVLSRSRERIKRKKNEKIKS